MARRVENPNEIVDVLCQCGWGVIAIPIGRVPDDCPTCGLKLGTREEWVEAPQDVSSSRRPNRGPATSWAERVAAADPTSAWGTAPRSARLAPERGWVAGPSRTPELTRSHRLAEMRDALAYADPKKVDAGVWAQVYDLVPRDVIDAAADLGFQVIDPCWPDTCQPYSGLERNPRAVRAMKNSADAGDQASRRRLARLLGLRVYPPTDSDRSAR